jgi:hypothetical protein
MPVAMVRNDSMALDDLKEISFRRSYDGRNSPLKWECQRMFSSEMQLMDLCESSSDHYSSDGCFDDEADLHSIIWTAGVLAGPGDALTLYDTENHDNTQIISPCTDEAAHLLPLCLWNQDDNLDLALHVHSEPQTPISIVPTLNTQESSEIKSTSPRAVHGGKSERLFYYTCTYHQCILINSVHRHLGDISINYIAYPKDTVLFTSYEKRVELSSSYEVRQCKEGTTEWRNEYVSNSLPPDVKSGFSEAMDNILRRAWKARVQNLILYEIAEPHRKPKL